MFDRWTRRYRVTVLAHRRAPAHPVSWTDSSIVAVRTVRARTPQFARDLVLVTVHAESALVADVRVGVDAVLVERLRLGRPPLRELDSHRVAVVG